MKVKFIFTSSQIETLLLFFVATVSLHGIFCMDFFYKFHHQMISFCYHYPYISLTYDSPVHKKRQYDMMQHFLSLSLYLSKKQNLQSIIIMIKLSFSFNLNLLKFFWILNLRLIYFSLSGNEYRFHFLLISHFITFWFGWILSSVLNQNFRICLRMNRAKS